MKRILACLFITAVFPLMASVPRSGAPGAASPIIAYAGHTIPSGGWCECGTPNCICDPGEDPGIHSVTPVTDNPKAPHQRQSPVREQSRSDFDFGTGTLLFALALLLWARLRG